MIDTTFRAILLVVAVIIVLVIFALLGSTIANSELRDGSPLAQCLAFGYPRTEVGNAGWYCIRTVNGTEEVKLLKHLKAPK